MAVDPQPDGERYLRLLFEEVVASDDRHDVGRFGLAATSLVAAGVVDGAVADQLQSDLELARNIREPHFNGHSLIPMWLHGRPDRDQPGMDAPAGPPLTVSPIAVGPVAVRVGKRSLWVLYVSTGPNGRACTAVDPWDFVSEETDDEDPASSPRQHPSLQTGPVGSRRSRLGHFQSSVGPTHNPAREASLLTYQVEFKDDRGRVYQPTSSSGSPTRDQSFWRYDCTLDAEPPADVRWFDVRGPESSPVRVPVALPSDVQTHVTPSPVSAAEIHVLQHLFAAAVGTEMGLRTAVESLVGAGALDADHPLVTQAELLTEADYRQPAPVGLDHRLASAFDATAGERTLGYQADDRAQMQCAPVGLAIDGEGWSAVIDVAVALDGWLEIHGRIDRLPLATPLPFAIAARDDLGRWHLGSSRSAHRSDGERTAWAYVIGLAPRLHPHVSHVTLTLTTTRAEHTVEVPLR